MAVSYTHLDVYKRQEWQMAVTSMNHPALAANITQAYGAGVGRIGKYYEQGNWYRGGAHQLLFTSWLYGCLLYTSRCV